MKNIFLIFLICIITFSCNLVTKDNQEEALLKFNNLTDLDKIEYFNSLNSRTQFYILNNFIADKCFEIPIHNVIKFNSNGNLWVDWMILGPNGLGLVYASGEKEPFKKYIPLKWEIYKHYLVIKKNKQYSEYAKVKGEDDLIFDFQKKNEVIFDKVYLSLFQNKIQVTLKNKKHQMPLTVAPCEKWPVMDTD